MTTTPTVECEPTASAATCFLYRLLDDEGNLLYVGIAGDCDARFRQHAGEKPWWPRITTRRVEEYPTRADAEFAEAVAILLEGPYFNKAIPTVDRLEALAKRSSTGTMPAPDVIVRAQSRQIQRLAQRVDFDDARLLDVLIAQTIQASDRRSALLAETRWTVTTEEAAVLLGVTMRRAQQMLDAGDLTRVARGLVDRVSVERYLAGHQGSRTRVWAEHTAWGAIALLSGERPGWMGQAQASRLRTALRETTDASDLVARLRDRARVHVYTGHRSATSRLRDGLIRPDRARLGLVLADEGVDGYLAADRLDDAVRRYALREDAAGSFVLRTTGFDLDVVGHLAATSTVLAAVDAASSLDPRERGVGERALAEYLERFRG